MRNPLKLNNFLLWKKKVVQIKQRKHTFTRVNATFGENAMSQARVLTEKEIRKVLNFCNTQPHSARNKAMLLCTHMAGSCVRLLLVPHNAINRRTSAQQNGLHVWVAACCVRAL